MSLSQLKQTRTKITLTTDYQDWSSSWLVRAEESDECEVNSSTEVKWPDVEDITESLKQR